jgi:hypothetical protein
MAIKKAFVIKDGLEVNSDVLIVSGQTKNVGIGSTIPRVELDLRGRFIATDSYLTGISTVINELNVGTNGTVLTALGSGSVGVGTALPNYLLDVRSSVSTGQTALYVQGDTSVTGKLDIGGSISFSGFTALNANITGIATIGTVKIFSGIVTATSTSGVVTYYGDGSKLTNISASSAVYAINSGIATYATSSGISSTATYALTAGISTAATYATSAGIATYATSSGIATYATSAGISSALTAAASVNTTGIITAASFVGNGSGLTNVPISGIATYATSSGTATYATSSGIATSVMGGIASVAQLNVSGVSTFSGITTYTASLFGTTASFTGVVTALSFSGSGANLTGLVAGVGIATAGGTVGTGATFLDFRGSGISTVTVSSGIATINISGGGGGGVTISDDISTNATRYLTFTDSTSGSISAANVSSTNLQFNPLSGNLAATQFTSLSDATQKTNVRPIENPIEITKQLDGVRFDWINNNKPSLGLIAQEVEKVLPELVETNSDGIKSVSYSNMVGLLIEAIKEQQVRIEELERKLDA